MISKQLLSEVFKKDVIGIIINPKEDLTLGKNEISIFFDGYKQKWNIYELAHKCKEWALSKGYELHSKLQYDNKGMCNIEKFEAKAGMSCRQIIKYTYSDSEIEAIFKACEWILNNKVD